MSSRDENIEGLKKYAEKEMNAYSERVRQHIDRHGSDLCDYLSHQLQMSNYHRGGLIMRS